MASGPEKPKDSAEKAYAAAAAKAGPAKAAAPAKSAPAKKKKPVAVKKAPKPVVKVSRPFAAPVAAVVEAPEPVVPVVEVSEPVLAIAEVEGPVAEASKPEVPVEVLPPKPTLIELKEKIMATAKTTDFTKARHRRRSARSRAKPR
jgi:hypothetical protein